MIACSTHTLGWAALSTWVLFASACTDLRDWPTRDSSEGDDEKPGSQCMRTSDCDGVEKPSSPKDGGARGSAGSHAGSDGAPGASDQDAGTRPDGDAGGQSGSPGPKPVEPGPTRQTAFDFEQLGSSLSTWPTGSDGKEFAGNASDADDWYRFVLSENGTVTYGAHVMSGSVQIKLFASEIILNEGTPQDSLVVNAGSDDSKPVRLEKGEYYLQVVAYGSASALYRLSLLFDAYDYPERDPPPGHKHADALTLDSLDDLQEAAGFVDDGAPDYYRLEIAADTMVVIQADEVLGSIQARLVNDEQVLTTGMQIDSFVASTAPMMMRQAVQAGTYYVIVSGTRSLYHLSMMTP